MATYIEDGFTRNDGYLAAAPKEKNGEILYDAVRFSYRPCTRLELLKHDAAMAVALADQYTNTEAREKADKISCQLIISKLVSWDIKNSKGVVPITEHSLHRINELVFQAIDSIIRGRQVSDPIPGEEKKPSDEAQLKNSDTVSNS